MRAIWKQNFMAYFNSPMGYIFVFSFVTIMNLLFFLFNVVGSSSDITGLFSIMLILLIILIPFVTMRTFSEEYKLRTDQLLLTVPTDIWRIVLGKFMAVLSVLICALAFTLLWVVIISKYGVIEAGVVLGNYVAIMCASAAFVSIGMMISSLTENQIIAAIGTLGLFIALFVINTITMNSLSKNFSGVFFWFSLFSRYQGFILGIFSFADIFYYMSFTVVMLFLTTRILEKKRWD